ncbi:unnamed protein product, partial [Lepidochelys kempii]
TCVSPAVENGRTNGVQRAYRPSSCEGPTVWQVLCIAPEVQNGRKVAGHGPVYRPRDTVRFECDPGYTLNGSRQIQCRDEGIWDPPVPACTQRSSRTVNLWNSLPEEVVKARTITGFKRELDKFME